jgi:hypothetical protein
MGGNKKLFNLSSTLNKSFSVIVKSINSFSTSVGVKESFSVIAKISQSFSLVKISQKSFAFTLDFFDFITTSVFRIKQKINFLVNSSARIKHTTSIFIKKIKTTVLPQYFQRHVQTIGIKPIGITISFRGDILISSQLMNMHKLILGFVSKVLGKVTADVRLKMSVDIVPQLGTINILGTFDPETLATLDTKTLGEMDFTVF